MPPLPPTADVLAALAALALAVGEARRVRRGGRTARIWFVAFLLSALIFSAVALHAVMHAPSPG